MPRKLWIQVLLALATCATFWRALEGDFLRVDDPINVYENPYVAPGDPSRVGTFWKGTYEGLYVPLTYTTWTAIAAVATRAEPRRIERGPETLLDAWPFKAVNLALHVASALLVFALLRRLVSDDLAAGVGALLFALHPVQVEPVAWITGLKDVLCGALSLAALWQYVRFASEPEAKTRRSYTLACVFFVLALLAKPSAVVVPVLAFTIDRWVLGRPWRAATVALAPWVLLSIVWAFLASSAQDAADPTMRTELWQRPLIAGDALTFYLRELVWPSALAPDYGRTPVDVLASPWSKVAWLVPVALLVVAFVLRKRWPPFLVALLLFLIALLPVAGFVPFSFQRFATVADRYLYVAMLGPALALAALLRGSRSRVALGACALVLCALAVRSALQSRHWRNTVALFERTLEVNPKSGLAYSHLADVAADEGRTDEAIAKLEEALRLHPNYAELHHSLGAMFEEQGRLADAVQHYQAALGVSSSFAPSLLALAKLLIAQGQGADAIPYLRAAIEVQPHDAELRYTLGNAQYQAQNLREAQAAFAEAVRIQPDFAMAHTNLGLVQMGLGQTSEAAESLMTALRYDPDLAEAHANLGLLLANFSNQPEAAIPHLRAALERFPDAVPLKEALAKVQGAPAQQ